MTASFGAPMLNRDMLKRNDFGPPHGFEPSDDSFRPVDPGNAAYEDKIFFAIQPPPFTAPSLSRLAWYLRDKHRLAGDPLRRESFPAPCLFAGYHPGIPPQTLNAIRQAAATVVMPRFRVGFDWVVSFRNGRNRPLVLRGDDGVSGLIALRHRLVAA